MTESGGPARTLAQERHERIVHEVKLRGSARVADLGELLGVSDMTIRRDLDALDDAGLVVKVHGGATAVVDHTTNEPSFVTKSLRSPGEKAAITQAAAAFVHPGSSIAISAGTTTWRLAGELLEIADLTVVTNSVRVADVFASRPRPDRSVILTGGTRTPSDALVGPIAIASLRSLHVDRLFIGVHGMSARAGFSTPNLSESDTNRALFAAADDRIVLADSSKWGVVGLSSFADLTEADIVITDTGLDHDAFDLLDERVARVIRTSPINQPSAASETLSAPA